MPTDYDGAWKFAVEHLLAPMLELLMPDLWAAVDWSVKPVYLDKELPNTISMARHGGRFVDKLVRLQLKDRRPFLLLLHIEIQNRPDPDFEYRMYCYFHCLAHDHRHQAVITSLAILSDLHPNWHPAAYTSGAFGTQLTFQCPTVKLLDLEPTLGAHIAAGQPFALVVAAHLAAARTGRAFHKRSHWKWHYLQLALEHSRSAEETRIVLNFVDWVMTLPSDLDIPIKEHFNQRVKEANMPYFGGIFGDLRKEIYDEGVFEGKRDSLLALIVAKFGAVPETAMARISAASPENLERWLINVLRMDHIDQVLS